MHWRKIVLGVFFSILLVASIGVADADDTGTGFLTTSESRAGFAFSTYPIQVQFSKEKGWTWADARYMRSLSPAEAIEFIWRGNRYHRNANTERFRQLSQNSAPIIGEKFSDLSAFTTAPALASRLNETWLTKQKESSAKLGTSCVSVGCDISASQILVSSFIRNESSDPSIDKAALATLAAVTKILQRESPAEPIDRYTIEFYKDRVNVFRIGRVPNYPDAYESQF